MSGKIDINSKKVIVPPIPPAVPGVGMPASTLFDMVMGVDVHIVNIPSPAGPIPTPLPHPAIGIAFDATLLLPPISIPVPYCIAAPAMEAMAKVAEITAPLNQNVFAMGSTPPPPPPEPPPPPDPDAPPPPAFLMVPTGVGASVLINSVPRTNVSTKYKQMPPHIPMGAGFTIPSNIKNGGHAFMGSLTVNVEGNPFTYAVLPFTSCQCIGKPDSEDGGMSLPTTIVTPIPKGPAVLIGGPPVPVLTVGDILKGGMKFLKKLMKKSGLMKKISNWLHKVFKAKAGSWKSKIICFFTGHPVDVASGYFYTSKTDFKLPGPIPLVWERDYYSRSKYQGPLGHGWHHCYDLSIEMYEEIGGVGLRLSDGRMVALPLLKPGDDPYFERDEKIDWFKDEHGFAFTNKQKLTYRFAFRGGVENIHRLISIENTSGNKIIFEYNTESHLIKIIDSANRTLNVNCAGDGRINSIQLQSEIGLKSSHTFIKYFYDDLGNLVNSQDALSQSMKYYYNNHLMVRETDRNGLSFYFEYDGDTSEARCIKTYGDNNIYFRKLEYYEGVTFVEDLAGNRTQYYHENGVVYKTIDPQGGVTLTVRNEVNDIIEEVDEEGLSTIYSYDNRGNQVGINYPGGSGVGYQFENDLPVNATDKIGGLWMWEYDENGKVIKQTDPLGNITEYEYTNGMLTAIIRSDQSKTLIEYDDEFNVSKFVFPDGNNSTWEFDKLGRCIEFVDVNGSAQYRRYDVLGRVIEITEPDGNKVVLNYDAEGNVIKAKDKLRDVEFEYSGMGKMTRRKENNTQLEFTYDKEEQLIGVKNEKGTPYNFKLDILGNVTEEIGYDGIKRKFKRDKAGKTVRIERPGNKFSKFEYDEGGRINKVIQYDDTTEVFIYDQAGNLVEAANENTILKFERDVLGRIIKESQSAHVIESAYDKKGNRISVKSSLGADIKFERNALGDVTQISASNGMTDWVAKIQHDAMGLEIARDLPGGIKSRWQRDKLGRPLQHQVSDGKTIHRSRQYLWDYDDQLKQMVDQSQGTTQFGHDAVGNLTWAKYNDGYMDYHVADETGNYYNSRDRSDRKFGPAGQLLESRDAKYDYDTEGNLIQKTTRKGEIWRYEWLANGMLKKVSRPDKQVVSFTYDPLGRRLSKTFKENTTRWVWDANTLLHEWIEDIQLTYLTVDTKGELKETPKPENLTTWIFQAESFVPAGKLLNGEKYTIITDHLGTPAEMYNGKGDKVWEINLNIYGEVRSIEGLRNECPFRYPGQYEDDETGLYYNRFRYYESSGGFYISQDPIGLSGNNSNFYAYVHDTNSYIDVFGLMPGIVRVPISNAGPPQTGGRATGINRAWGEERDMINRTGGGTRNWTPAERAIILDPNNTTQDITSQMSRAGYTGHHINNVNDFPEWQGDPRNIVFLPNANHPTLGNEHLTGADGHNGAFQNRTTGDLIDRPNCTK